MQPEEMIKMPAEISALMTERLGIRGKALSPKLRRARRLLPKQVREAAQLLAGSEPRLQNPKLITRLMAWPSHRPITGAKCILKALITLVFGPINVPIY